LKKNNLKNAHWWQSKFFQALEDYALITIGSLIVAANVNLFLVPNNVISTGITGIGMLANYLWHWPIGIITLILNIPLFLAGIRWGGGLKFFTRSIYAVVVMTIAIDITTGLQGVMSDIHDPLLYTLFGGLLDGIGIGLVLRGQGTTGGTDIVAQLLHRYRAIPFSTTFLAVNGIILLGGVIIVGWAPILYALVVNFVSSRVVDTVQEGVGYARSVMIISRENDAVRDRILHDLSRGVTVLEAHGGYTQTPRPALYVVVMRDEVSRLKRMIAEIDPDAFVVVSEAHEVLGEGFQPVANQP